MNGSSQVILGGKAGHCGGGPGVGKGSLLEAPKNEQFGARASKTHEIQKLSPVRPTE